MEFVGAALGDHVDVRTCVAAIRRIVLACLYLELLNRIRVRNGNASAERTTLLQVIDLDAIHLEVVVGRGSAIGDERFFPVTASSAPETTGISDVRCNSR